MYTCDLAYPQLLGGAPGSMRSCLLEGLREIERSARGCEAVGLAHHYAARWRDSLCFTAKDGTLTDVASMASTTDITGDLRPCRVSDGRLYCRYCDKAKD